MTHDYGAKLAAIRWDKLDPIDAQAIYTLTVTACRATRGGCFCGCHVTPLDETRPAPEPCPGCNGTGNYPYEGPCHCVTSPAPELPRKVEPRLCCHEAYDCDVCLWRGGYPVELLKAGAGLVAALLAKAGP